MELVAKDSHDLVCLACGGRYPRAEFEGTMEVDFPPRCACGQVLKPDVVFFGEPIPPEALAASWEAAKRCDVMIVVGTSAVVYPAAELPVLARRAGAKVIEVNIEPTPLTGTIAEVTLLESATTLMPRLVAAVRTRLAQVDRRVT